MEVSQSMEKLTNLLIVRAREHGAMGFSLHGEVVPLANALDPIGPVTWAIILHADALSRLAGMKSKTGAPAILPVTCGVSEESPFGNLAAEQVGNIPFALCAALLDSALEHAVCVGMQHYGYTPAGWEALEENEKVIPIEPYFADLQANWITEALESGDPMQIVNAWPSLMDREMLESMANENRNHLGNGSRVLTLPSIR